MKKLLLLMPLLFIGCISQKVIYSTTDISVPTTQKPIPAMVEIRILTDNRSNLKENDILFSETTNQTFISSKRTCINAEKYYKKDSVVTQISRIMAEHFNKARLFKMTFFNNSNYSSYYLTGTLNSFYGEQEFSTAAAVGAQFGLIGAIATANVKTPGKIVIEMADLKLYKKDGTLVKDFGSFFKEYKDDFKADANCWCIYWNINDKLKDFNSSLIEKIRTDMEGIQIE